jgi:hypothetical protein
LLKTQKGNFNVANNFLFVRVYLINKFMFLIYNTSR